MFLKPLGVQRRYVPHFKGLISAKVDLEAQGRDSTFTFCHAQLKKAILLHKRAAVSICVTVNTFFGQSQLTRNANARDTSSIFSSWLMCIGITKAN